MKKVGEGSTLLIIVLVLASIVVLVTNNYRNATYESLIVTQQNIMYNTMQVAQTLLDYGSAFARENFDVFSDTEKVQIVNGPWLEYTGNLTAQKNNDHIHLVARIKTDKQTCMLSCNLVQLQVKQFVIRNWHMDVS